MAFEPIPRLAKKPELSAGQACGILKYHRLALLDSYVFKLIKSETASLRRWIARSIDTYNNTFGCRDHRACLVGRGSYSLKRCHERDSPWSVTAQKKAKGSGLFDEHNASKRPDPLIPLTKELLCQ